MCRTFGRRVAPERWRLAGWLGGVSPLRVTRECIESCQTWGETPPGQPNGLNLDECERYLLGE